MWSWSNKVGPVEEVERRSGLGSVVRTTQGTGWPAVSLGALGNDGNSRKKEPALEQQLRCTPFHCEGKSDQ